jgi:hypothetical protein
VGDVVQRYERFFSKWPICMLEGKFVESSVKRADWLNVQKSALTVRCVTFRQATTCVIFCIGTACAARFNIEVLFVFEIVDA